MPDRVIRWRTADGRTGTVRAAAPLASRRAARPPSQPAPPVASSDQTPGLDAEWRALRDRLGLPETATRMEIAVAAGRASRPRAASAPAPAARPPLVAAAEPTEAELVEEARWEESTARLFRLPTGPASRALAERGLPSVQQRRSDAHAAAQQEWVDTFNRNAEAARLADVARIDAARASVERRVAEDREARQRRADAALWPELGG
jgi:hypothetical protein